MDCRTQLLSIWPMTSTSIIHPNFKRRLPVQAKGSKCIRIPLTYQNFPESKSLRNNLRGVTESNLHRGTENEEH